MTEPTPHPIRQASRRRPRLGRGPLAAAAGLLVLAACDGGDRWPEADRGDGGDLEVVRLEGLDDRVERVTGGHTRVVWMWHQSTKSTDTYASGESHFLAGFDSRDGEGVRVILGERDSYARPLLSADGKTIVFTDKNTEKKGGKKHYAPKIHRLPWGGGFGELEEIADGLAVDVWRDPASGIDWVYAVDDLVPSSRASVEARKLVRFRLDEPSERETVFEGRISPDNVQLSRDGRLASGLFPWPDGGVLETGTGKWHRTTGGCWTSMAPDDSGVSWVFDGAHRTVRMFSADRGTRWKTAINVPEEVGGREVYHPRWSNHPRVFAMTGPYGKAGPGENPISKGGAFAEIYVARFSGNLRKVEEWVRLTDNETGDFFPDVWVEGGGAVSLDPGALGVGSSDSQDGDSSDGWPAASGSLAFQWLDNDSENRVGDRVCRFEAVGIGRFGPSFEMLLDGGGFVADDESNAALAAGAAAGGSFGLEFALRESVSDGAGPPPAARLVAVEDGAGGLLVGVFREGGNLVVRAGAGGVAVAEAEVAVAEGVRTIFVGTSPAEGLVFAVDGDMRNGGGAGVDLSAWGGARLVAGAAGAAAGKPAEGYRAHVGAVAATTGLAAMPDGARLAAAREAAVVRWGEAEPPPRLRIRGRLVEAAGMPSARDLDTYRRALIDCTYEVVSVEEGDYDEERIVVLHWALLDRRPVAGMPPVAGREYELIVEPVDAHPELESERQTATSSDLFLDRHYDVATPALADRPGS